MRKNIKDQIRKFVNLPTTLSEKFHYKTNNKISSNRNSQIGKLLDNLKSVGKFIEYKTYPNFKKIKLPPPLRVRADLIDSLIERKSERNFSGKTLFSKRKISTLLYYSLGINRNNEANYPRRFYPSAGAAYPIETYLLSLNSELEKGVYHYNVINHILEEMYVFSRVNLKKMFLSNWLKETGIVIFLTIVFRRICEKYGDRGYRFALIEAGHIGQNIYLISRALNLNCCSLGSSIENEIDKLLDLEVTTESLIYTLAVG